MCMKKLTENYFQEVNKPIGFATDRCSRFMFQQEKAIM
jgi:hypothetical protein